MKKLFTIFCLLAAAGIASAQKYTVTDAGSSVKFTIRNFGLNVTGSFTGLTGNITFDPANIAAAAFVVSVSAASVNTNNTARDKHLKKDDYFNVAKHPSLTFVSSKVSGSAGSYTIEGLLTIKGITKKISFPFTATPGNNGYQFAGKFGINRRDFSVGGSSWVLADELTVTLNISATK